MISAVPRWWSGLRVPVRFKLLGVFCLVLFVALGTYLYLATSLFARDKLAYVYDANLALADGLAAQTDANLQLLSRMLLVTGRELGKKDVAPAEARAVADELFAIESELFAIEIYERRGDRMQRVQLLLHERMADELELQPSDVEQVRDERPLPLEAVLASPGMLFVQGFTLAPDVALLSLAVAHPGAERPLVVAALFRPDRLLRIVGASRMHETWIVDERGELVMHADVGRLLAPEGSAQHPLVREGLTARADRGVTTYARTDDAEVMLGAWSRVESARLLVLTQLPKRVALTATRELIVRSALFAAAVLLLALLASLYLSRRLTDPIRRLRAAAEQVGSGRFDVQLDTSQRDELGELAEAFAQMARALQTAQAQLIRSEKMAAFGQLGAGITHEVKNPVAGIVGLAQVAQKQLTRPDKVREILKLIESEGLRCSEILVNFLRFAREEPAVPERHLVDVNEVVTAAARMFSHQLAATEVSLSLRLAPDAPQVLGGTNELQQVLVNLAINAQQAMGRGGTVTIETGADDGWAWILFSDTGPGIPAHLRDRIFEPFFTTKQPGEGTGLGLSVSYAIVRDHGGEIVVDPGRGEGCTFRIRLPLADHARAAGRQEVANG